jgi:hypothetical protein
VHHGAVVDLRAERAGADDQRGERQDHAQPEADQHLARPQGRFLAAEPPEQSDADQHQRQGDEQQGPLPPEQATGGDPDDRPVEDGHDATR